MTENTPDNHNTDRRPRIDGPRVRPLEETPGLYLDRPPSARVEQEERNRLTQERASDERLAVEVARTNQSVRAAQEARTALYGAQKTDGLAPGERHPSPELPAGELGDAIRGLLKLERIEGAYSRALARLDEERLSHAQDSERGWEAAAEAVAAEAVRAGMRKEAVPPICGPVFDALTEQADAALFTYRHFERIQRFIEAKAVIAAPAAMGRAYDDADATVCDAASAAIALAGEARDALGAAGLTVDADLEQVVDAGVEGTVEALSKWRRSVQQWRDVQQIRAWWRAAIVRGFEFDRAGHIRVVPPPRIPSGPHARQHAIDAAARLAGVEAGVLLDQVVWYPPEHYQEGRDMGVTTPPTGVRGLGVAVDAHSTLRTWLTTTRLLDPDGPEEERWAVGPNGLDAIKLSDTEEK
ncbi:hypothetical protein FK529_09315 [Tsukamurella asaccharolytica]|uniref:Uncharacterized protein n=1 Tax=Tsukamurella asaccharolytica TaxID=2592067 RepID=A0A5C5R8V0_9ACTN|nr:hypothetical protein [Tsukamurella asaccharolytica]TWS19390.1 hypothetical protein FK529_09315 [Tsukamurella asaccharolytica]